MKTDGYWGLLTEFRTPTDAKRRNGLRRRWRNSRKSLTLELGMRGGCLIDFVNACRLQLDRGGLPTATQR